MNTNTVTGWIGQIQGYIDTLRAAPAWAQTAVLLLAGVYIWMRYLPHKFTVWKFTLHFPDEALGVLVPVAGMFLNSYLSPEVDTAVAEKVAKHHEVAGGFLTGLIVVVLFPAIVKYVFPKIPYVGPYLYVPDPPVAPEK